MLNNDLLNVQCFLALSGIFLYAFACLCFLKYECSLFSLAFLRAGDMYLSLIIPDAFLMSPDAFLLLPDALFIALSFLHGCPGAALISLNFVLPVWLQQQLAAQSCFVPVHSVVHWVHLMHVHFAC